MVNPKEQHISTLYTSAFNKKPTLKCPVPEQSVYVSVCVQLDTLLLVSASVRYLHSKFCLHRRGHFV